MTKKEKKKVALVTFKDADRECAIGGYFKKGEPVKVPVDQVGNFAGIDPEICDIRIVDEEEPAGTSTAAEGGNS